MKVEDEEDEEDEDGEGGHDAEHAQLKRLATLFAREEAPGDAARQAELSSFMLRLALNSKEERRVQAVALAPPEWCECSDECTDLRGLGSPKKLF